jgi:hypothetical protein
MPMLQLDPPIPVLVKAKEAWVKGMAHVMIDYGYEHDLHWVVFADESRECWTAANRNVRAQENITAGRMQKPPPEITPN